MSNLQFLTLFFQVALLSEGEENLFDGNKDKNGKNEEQMDDFLDDIDWEGAGLPTVHDRPRCGKMPFYDRGRKSFESHPGPITRVFSAEREVAKKLTFHGGLQQGKSFKNWQRYGRVACVSRSAFNFYSIRHIVPTIFTYHNARLIDSTINN